MGGKPSKTNHPPLSELSADELASLLETELGPKYAPCARAVRENGVDGVLLASFREEEFIETLDDLDVNHRLHRRVLMKEWKQAMMAMAGQPLLQQQQRLEETFISDDLSQQQQSGRPKPLDAAGSSSSPAFGSSLSMSHMQSAAPRGIQKIRKLLQAQHPEWIDHKNKNESVMQISVDDEEVQKLFQAVSAYDFTEDTDPAELVGFDKLVERASTGCPNAVYAGIHMWDVDGHVSLSNRFVVLDDSQPSTERMHVPREVSECYRAILGCNDDDAEGDDLVMHPIPPGTNPFIRHDDDESNGGNALYYVGHVTRNKKGQKVGIVCVVVEHSGPTTDDKQADDDGTQELLRELAADAEQQLELRRVLLERNATLQNQINATETETTTTTKNATPPPSSSTIVLPSFGPISKVTESDLAQRRKSFFPTVDEIATSGQPRRTAALPFCQEDRAAPQEMVHLPGTFFDAYDALGTDPIRPPIHKNDMERVAYVEEIGIKEMSPDDPEGASLTRLCSLAARLLDCEFVNISILQDDQTYSLVNYFRDDRDPDTERVIKDIIQPLKTDREGSTWLGCNPRSIQTCNYVLFTGETLVTHDTGADESFRFLKDKVGMQFTASAPILLNGYIVATLCIFDFRRPHPEFGVAHEIQFERIAQMISSHMQNYVLRREMEKLEQVRRRIGETREGLNHRRTSLAPESSAAIVFTDVQGSTALWEADPDAMHDALRIHDRIMRKNIAAHSGYEIGTEGDAFAMAFHDCIDAVGFALDVQVSLHDAEWSNAILALPDACIEEQNCFRGLRVRIAIHHGAVEHRKNDVSEQREYVGATVNIAKSLEHCCHGGQILVSSDVWIEASSLAETELGSPQVLDLGTHVLLRGTKLGEGVVSKSVLQIVPSSLAYDFTMCSSIDAGSHNGRQFPPILSMKQVSASFHDAPCSNSCAAMLFVYTSEIDRLFNNAAMILAALAKQLGALLLNRNGYQCKNFMLAFQCESDAVEYGLDLQEHLDKNKVLDASLAGFVKVGVHHGPFTSMEPNPRTGRADYFGKVVNRAARVAGAADAGQVWVGMLSAQSPEIRSAGVLTSFVGSRMLKGVQEPIFLYACKRS